MCQVLPPQLLVMPPSNDEVGERFRRGTGEVMAGLEDSGEGSRQAVVLGLDRPDGETPSEVGDDHLDELGPLGVHGAPVVPLESHLDGQLLVEEVEKPLSEDITELLMTRAGGR